LQLEIYAGDIESKCLAEHYNLGIAGSFKGFELTLGKV
jgi:hypothetical protein